MKHSIVTLLCLFVTMATHAQLITKTLYCWESPSGTVIETGGAITQHNNLAISRINYPSSGYYTIQLCGKKEYLTAEDNSLNAVYFTITLNNEKPFKAGDIITVTAMRNNDTGGKATIYFQYSFNDATTSGDPTASRPVVGVSGTNTWANLGQMHEINFNGGTKAKGIAANDTNEEAVSESSQANSSIKNSPPWEGQGEASQAKSSIKVSPRWEGKGEATGAGTEPVGSFSLDPSTNTFVVPEAADGSTALTLTLNDSECMLYITRFLITRNVTPLKGDANADGTIDMTDAKLAVEQFLGKNPKDIDLDNADMNNDGRVTISDANAIVNKK